MSNLSSRRRSRATAIPTIGEMTDLTSTTGASSSALTEGALAAAAAAVYDAMGARPSAMYVSENGALPLPPIQPMASSVPPQDVKIGDIVQVIDNCKSPTHFWEIGTKGKIYEMRGDDCLVIAADNNTQIIAKRDLMKITGAFTPPPVPVETQQVKEASLSKVIIDEDKKEQIHAAISQVENDKLIFKDWGFDSVFEKGTAVTLLFYGVPGTGKTLMAQAIADGLSAELKIYGTADIQTSEPGGAERAIKKVFDEAKKIFQASKKQRVILFDECDSLLYDRNKVGVILAAQINALLSEIERHDGVVIFTTNRVGKLDPALERRISAKIEFTFPNKVQREAIWRGLMPTKAPLAGDVDFAKLAKHEMAGGNIKNVVLNAARMAAYKKSPTIAMEHFAQAIKKEMVAIEAFSMERGGKHTEHEDARMDDNNQISIKRVLKTGLKKR